MTHDRETVSAYVDGELDDVAAARVSRAAETDADLAHAIAAERSLRDALGAHFAPIMAEPVPEQLVEPIKAARKVISFEQARARRFGFTGHTLRWAGPAIAAALVLAVVLPSMNAGQTESRDGLTFAANDLERALDGQLVANQRPGSETRMLLSFADTSGTLCRGFARADLSGIACRETGGWHVRVQRDGVDVSSSDYRQAGSVDTAILEAAQDMAAGPALDAEAELAARRRGWRAQ